MGQLPPSRQDTGHENLVSNSTHRSSTKGQPKLALPERLGVFTCGREE